MASASWPATTYARAATAFDRTFDDAVGVVLATNRVYVVTMVADAQAAATDAGSRALARAFVDPVFTFAPGVDPELYAFRFSEGIGNAVAAVPEPATSALLAAGLLALAAARRRVRRSPTDDHDAGRA